MSEKAKIEADLKQALKNKEELKLSVLRLLLSSIHNAEIEKRRTLKDEEIYQVLNKEIKQRKEAKEEYQKGKRSDLAQKEEKERKILSSYLPPQLSQEEIKSKALEAIQKTKAKGPSEIGKVMAELMPKTKGRASGASVAQIVKEELEKGV